MLIEHNHQVIIKLYTEYSYIYDKYSDMLNKNTYRVYKKGEAMQS